MATQDTKTGKKKTPAKERGLFEKPPGSGIWWVRWYDEHGKVHREKAGRRDTAKKIYASRTADAWNRRKTPQLRQRDLTVADMVKQYEPEILSKNQRSKAEYKRHGSVWTDQLGDAKASAVTAGEIEAWKAKRLEKVAGSTVNGSIRYLKMLYNLALRDGLVEKNPLANGRVALAKESAPRDRILSPDEERKLEETLPRPFWLQVQIALNTGLRQSEQFGAGQSGGLREHVNLDRRLVQLPMAKGEKSGAPQWVKLNSVALKAYKEVLENTNSKWIWPNQHGTGPVDGTSITKKLQRACKKLGFPEGITWHALRHTFISRLCMMGVPLPTVQKMARHKSIKITLGYAHLCPDHEAEAFEALTRFGKTPKPSDGNFDTQVDTAEKANQEPLYHNVFSEL